MHYYSIVLCNDQRVTWLLGPAVKEVLLCNETEEKPPNFHELFKTNQPLFDGQGLEERKQKLCKWFEANLLPVEVNADKLIVANAVEILPPYDTESCIASNQIVLVRIQKLINLMESQGSNV